MHTNNHIKRLKLFEEYLANSTWNSIRDTIQTKKPFMIVTLKDDSNISSIKKLFNGLRIANQTAYTEVDNKEISFPSLFIFLDKDTNFERLLKTIFSNSGIKKVIGATLNSDNIFQYFDSKTSENIGTEVVSGISPNDTQSSDYYKIDSTYYCFIHF